MIVSLLQTDIVWGDPQANLQAAEDLIASHPGADLYVLPEMFTTGFATDPGSKIDDDPLRTLSWMRGIAERFDCAVAGSVAMRADTPVGPAGHRAVRCPVPLHEIDGDGADCVNRLLFVTPDGDVTYYDKRHLFTYGGEKTRFRAGTDRVVVEFRGVRFLLLVCYDIRFPVWIRNRGDYDAIICPANWPDARQEAWETFIKARAIEDQCYMLGVNRVGSDPVCNYLGGTTLYNPYGQVIARCEDTVPGVASGEISLEFLDNYRSKFPVLEDADDFVFV